ncbi:MAG: hypothetical protein AAGA99_22290 [Actinomycetota bacterium]
MYRLAEEPMGERPGADARRSSTVVVDGRLAARAAIVTLGSVIALGVDVRLATIVAVAGAAKVMSTPRSGLMPLRQVVGL